MSCLFRALGPTVNIETETLRKMIATYLRTNPKLASEVNTADWVKWSGGSLNDYTERMGKLGVWGGAIEIKAFCEMFDINVVVNVRRTGRQISFESSKGGYKTIHLIWTGNHYELLR